MWKLSKFGRQRTKLRLFILLAFLFSASLPAYASDSINLKQTYQITGEELQQLQNNWSKQKQINETLQVALNQSKQEITTLKSQLTESSNQLAKAETELITLKSQLTQSQTNLNQAENQSLTAQQLLTQQNKDLQTLKEKSQNQETLLAQVNQSFKEYSKEQTRTRRRIKNQRNFWEIVSGLAVIGLVRG